MTRITIGLCAAATLALVACKGKTEQPAAAAPAAPAVVAEGQLAPGLWDYTVTAEGIAPQPMRTCVDAAHATPMMGSQQCASVKRTKTGDNKWSLEADCSLGEAGTVKMTGEMSGDLQASYAVTMTAHMKPAGGKGAEQVVSFKVDAKKSADTCPATLKPGAIESQLGIIDSSGMQPKK